VRLYDLLSQIIDYGDTELERRSIFFRLLSRRIRTGPQGDPVDISDVQLVRVKQRRGVTGDLPLAKGEPEKLRPISGVGSGIQRDPKLGKLTEVVARLNELFSDEFIDTAQRQTWVEAVLHGMLANELLVAQARANTPAQFLGSPDLKDAVAEIVLNNQLALNKMADVFYADDTIRGEIVEMMGGLFHLHATSPPEPDANPAEAG